MSGVEASDAADTEKSFMLYLGGSRTSFRCDAGPKGHPCGANVFHKGAKPNSFVCNGCGAQYIGEKS